MRADRPTRGTMVKSDLATLEPPPESVPINALVPIEGTPLADAPAHIFRAYDIRGVVPDELSDEIARYVGIVVGSDVIDADDPLGVNGILRLVVHDESTASYCIPDVT